MKINNSNSLLSFYVFSTSLLMGIGSVFYGGTAERLDGLVMKDGGQLSAFFLPVISVIYLISFFLCMTRPQRLLYFTVNTKIVLLMVGFTISSVFWSVDPATSLRKGISLFGATVFAYSFFVMLNAEERIFCIDKSIKYFLILSCITIVLLPSIGIHQLQHEGALRGSHAHKNNFGWMCCISAVYFIIRNKYFPEQLRSNNYLKYLAIVLMLLSQSVTSILAFIGVATIIYFNNVYQSAKTLKVVLIYALGLTVSVFYFFGLEIAEFVLLSMGKSLTLTGRTGIWENLVPAILDRPFIGFGYQSFWGSSLVDVYFFGVFYSSHAHNGYLDLVIDLGFTGLVIFCLVILSIYFAWRSNPNSKSFENEVYAYFLIVTLIIGFSGGVILPNNSIYWCFVVFALISAVRKRND